MAMQEMVHFMTLHGKDVYHAVQAVEIPPQVTDILKKLQIYCGATIVGLASLMGMVAGLMRVLGLREEARKRYKDAIAGMAMVMTAPAIIGTIATILRGFFPDSYV